MPNGAAAVVGDEHAAVCAEGDAYGAAPDVAFRCDEPGEEVFVAAFGLAVVHGDADDLVASSFGSVPGAMLGGEGIAVILEREVLFGSGSECHLERRHVGLDEDVGNDDLAAQIDVLAGVSVWRSGCSLGICGGSISAGRGETRVTVRTDVVPGPAVKAVFLDGRHVVRDEVVAEIVTFIDGAPELAGDGAYGFAYAVANSGGVDLEELALGCELKDGSAMELLRRRVGIVDIRTRPDRDEHLGAVFGEDDITGPVAAAAKLGKAGKMFHDRFRCAGCDEIAGLVREAHDGVGVADVNPPGVGTGGVEVDAEGQVEASAGEGGDLPRLAVRTDTAQDEDLVSV